MIILRGSLEPKLAILTPAYYLDSWLHSYLPILIVLAWDANASRCCIIFFYHRLNIRHFLVHLLHKTLVLHVLQ